MLLLEVLALQEVQEVLELQDRLVVMGVLLLMNNLQRHLFG